MNLDDISDKTHDIRESTLWDRLKSIPLQIQKLHATYVSGHQLTWWVCVRLVVWGAFHGFPIFIVKPKPWCQECDADARICAGSGNHVG